MVISPCSNCGWTDPNDLSYIKGIEGRLHATWRILSFEIRVGCRVGPLVTDRELPDINPTLKGSLNTLERRHCSWEVTEGGERKKGEGMSERPLTEEEVRKVRKVKLPGRWGSQKGEAARKLSFRPPARARAPEILWMPQNLPNRASSKLLPFVLI